MEIERKFMVNILKLHELNLGVIIPLSIEQAYLSTQDSNEVRVRRVDKSICTLTIKSKGDLARKEVEFEIPNIKYEEIIMNKLYLSHIIYKNRYKIPLDGTLMAEVDVYAKNLLGLVTVEVEFESEEQANQFIKPNWFDREVTYDSSFKNRALCNCIWDSRYQDA
ncbi:hypothetical protein D3C81_07690 [compost metagenome]